MNLKDTHSLILFGPNSRQEIQLELLESKKSLALRVTGYGPEELCFKGVNYFWCLADFRIEFEKYGLKLACKGCQKNVFPGGMLGETSNGRIAYEFDNNGEVINRVDIFDVVEDSHFDSIVSFEEQKKFRKSIRKR